MKSIIIPDPKQRQTKAFIVYSPAGYPISISYRSEERAWDRFVNQQEGNIYKSKEDAQYHGYACVVAVIGFDVGKS